MSSNIAGTDYPASAWSTEQIHLGVEPGLEDAPDLTLHYVEAAPTATAAGVSGTALPAREATDAARGAAPDGARFSGGHAADGFDIMACSPCSYMRDYGPRVSYDPMMMPPQVRPGAPMSTDYDYWSRPAASWPPVQDHDLLLRNDVSPVPEDSWSMPNVSPPPPEDEWSMPHEAWITCVDESSVQEGARSMPVVEPADTSPGDGAPEHYEVKRGDSLSKIAPKLGLTWQQLYWANRDQIAHPDLIYPDQQLVIPSPDCVVPDFRYAPIRRGR